MIIECERDENVSIYYYYCYNTKMLTNLLHSVGDLVPQFTSNCIMWVCVCVGVWVVLYVKLNGNFWSKMQTDVVCVLCVPTKCTFSIWCGDNSVWQYVFSGFRIKIMMTTSTSTTQNNAKHAKIIDRFAVCAHITLSLHTEHCTLYTKRTKTKPYTRWLYPLPPLCHSL